MEQLAGGNSGKGCCSFPTGITKIPFCNQSQTATELMFMQHVRVHVGSSEFTFPPSPYIFPSSLHTQWFDLFFSPFS